MPQWRGHVPRTHDLQRDTSVNLLCVLWLITAPNTDSFADVLQHIRSFTTDHVVEAYMVSGEHWDSTDFPSTFLEKCVAQGLTFPFAVHIPDWNHITMHALRNACEAIECWTGFLAQMRSLTKCFRNEDYTFAIQVRIRIQDQYAIAAFRSVTAGFAWWRYRSVTVGAIASFVEQGFLRAFRNTKPKGLDDGCKDIEWWGFIQAVAPFMQNVDRLRQWSGGCSGHKAELLRGERVACDNKVMRLAGILETHLLPLMNRLRG